MKPDHIVVEAGSARRTWLRVRLPVVGSTILFVGLFVALSYDAEPPSVSPTRRVFLNQGEGIIQTLSFRPGGDLVAVTVGSSGVCLWSIASDDHGEPHGLISGFGQVALSSDGSVLAVGEDARVTLWDTATGARRIELLTPTDRTRALALSRDGGTVAVANERCVSVRSTATGHELVGVVPALSGVSSLAFSPDGRALATGDEEGYVRIWNLTKCRQRAAVRAHAAPVTCLRFSSDGTKLVSGCWGEYVPRIWDAATARHVTTLRRHRMAVLSAALSPDGRTLATVDLHGDLRLWETATGRQLATLAGNDGAVVTIVFSSDGRTLAAGGVGPTIWTWEVVQWTASPSRGSTVSEG
jgi:WD40 repeat protein